jgi:ribosome-binding ATPase YchF (GTP1/OBG family)
MMADDAESRDSILKEYGLTETGLNKIIHESNTMLNLHTYYTVGPEVFFFFLVPCFSFFFSIEQHNAQFTHILRSRTSGTLPSLFCV